jgi:hypothetical protein
MKRPLLLTAFALGLLAVACTTTTTRTEVVDPEKDTPSGEKGEGADPDDPANQPPHSLGTIMLGEAHASGASRVSPIVSATFLPDALLGRTCKRKLEGGCEIAEVPKCTKVKGSFNGCEEDEACTFDTASCEASCTKVAVCEEACEEDEVCRARSKTSSRGTCVKAETFDAGPIAFSGTTTPITLYPPYAYESSGSGAPFLAGATIQVQAQGAIDAGFEKFDESFTATKFLQTSPQLSKIPREKVFGQGPLPIAWVAGEDSILVSVSGAGGTATCKADDAAGKFDVPRSVIEAALGDEEDRGFAYLSLSVTRQKKDVKKDKKAKGELSSTKVQPEGWLELITLSTETASFEGCAGSDAICKDECVDLKTDPDNCGGCGKRCTASQSCSAGKCVDAAAACNSCINTQKSGFCQFEWSTCNADAECKALWSCLDTCQTQSCSENCVNMYPDGLSYAQDFANCAFPRCQAQCGN